MIYHIPEDQIGKLVERSEQLVVEKRQHSVNARMRVFEYFQQHPESVNFTVRKLETLIGVGKSTVSEARQEWRERYSQEQSQTAQDDR